MKRIRSAHLKSVSSGDCETDTRDVQSIPMYIAQMAEVFRRFKLQKIKHARNARVTAVSAITPTWNRWSRTKMPVRCQPHRNPFHFTHLLLLLLLWGNFAKILRRLEVCGADAGKHEQSFRIKFYWIRSATAAPIQSLNAEANST